ncbi:MULTISPECIES: hypothetical protein [Paenibacillus]|uniref:hypothetical protein n=1 Tax=Paenibacillus TaxID=44249 RepID=UPI00096C47D9|nr:hypothetical protein [Paenibacillus peoriae]OMF70354.1 hypothetical protein BK143_17760 [Paenibacillus peoriae]OMF81282.1 hypothetical protein BK145_07635 [Paenibacillus peoriae]
MHESEWLPWLLTKADMLRICNDFNLSIDGFRKSSLSTRSDELLRNLITAAMKKGIGAKRSGRGKILIHFFYIQISERILKEYPKYKDLSFEDLISELEMDYNLRPYEKLSLIYELHKEKYTEHVEKFSTNAKEKNEFLYGISTFTDEDIVERTILQFQNETNYPTLEEYIEFFKSCREQDRWEKVMSSLQEKKSVRVKFTWAMGLIELERLMAFVSLLSKHKHLEPIVYLLYTKEKEKRSQEIHVRTMQEVATASETTQQLTTKLDDMRKNNERLTQELNRMKNEVSQLNEEVVNYENIVKEKEDKLREKIDMSDKIENLNSLFFELIPKSRDAIIVTDRADARLKELFSNSLYPKRFLLREKENGTIVNLKSKVWFIDRSTFSNTREWVEIKNYFNQNGFQYDEYSDYVQLLKQYISVYN